MEFISQHFDKDAIKRLELVAESSFKRLPYTGTVEENGRMLLLPWGMDC